jgi:hypothetical protein
MTESNATICRVCGSENPVGGNTPHAIYEKENHNAETLLTAATQRKTTIVILWCALVAT